MCVRESEVERVCQMKYESDFQCLVQQLWTGLPVHDEAVGDDHLVQVVLIMSGDTEKVQIVAFLIISDLEQEEAISKRLALTDNVR